VTITPSLQRIPGYEQLVKRAREFNPHQRLTEPDDVGQAIALLSAAPSSWITGNVIGVDGGEILTT
jgi:NAD(P)-dependent dehydrogenase (short-subunit alcohol dehydrogenase family)